MFGGHTIRKYLRMHISCVFKHNFKKKILLITLLLKGEGSTHDHGGPVVKKERKKEIWKMN